MPSSTWRRDSPDRRDLFALWAGVLTGPVATLTLLEVQYVLAHVACEARTRWFLHVATVVALLLVGGAGYAAWAASRDASPDDHAHTVPASFSTRLQQLRWMSLAGMATSAWFAIVILALEVPVLLLQECR
ncbi:MAG TPA: hypothetical protein VMF13_23055 [Luteitalea sp.]|nr:hypothetical protein [Luteitalea sp.]